MKNPARLLAAGLATLALAGALAPLVMLGLIGLLLFPIGLVVVGAAFRAGRDDDPRATGGGGMAWLGALLVAVSAFQGGSLAFAVFIHRLHPGTSAPAASLGAWLLGLAIAVAGAALLSAALPQPGFVPGGGERLPGLGRVVSVVRGAGAVAGVGVTAGRLRGAARSRRSPRRSTWPASRP